MEEQAVVVNFHLGYMLCVAITAAVVHLLLVGLNPDMGERETQESWTRQVRILQFFLYLPLVGFFFTHASKSEEVGAWFLGTAIVGALLFIPIEMRLRSKKKPGTNTTEDATSDPAAHPMDLKSQDSANDSTNDSAKNIHQFLRPQTRPQPQRTHKAMSPEEFREVTRTHMRILMGNFALGLLMGAAILLPFLVAIGAIFTLKAYGVMTIEQSKTALKVVPGVCSLFVPIAMPVAFLMLGPWVLRFTQGARNLVTDPMWQQVWDRVNARAVEMGYNRRRPLGLFELPWANAGFKNAFYMGFPTRLNPFPAAVFLVKGIDQLLDANEMEFVLSHEMAHDLTRHTTKRVTLGLGLFAFFLICQLIAITLASPLMSLLFAVGCFFGGYTLMRRQFDLQELEADMVAINLSGGGEAEMQTAVSALKKLDQHNLRALHPLTVRRITALEAVYKGAKGTKEIMAHIDDRKDDDDQSKAA
jgi:Zn-dependent protease with chaperone function